MNSLLEYIDKLSRTLLTVILVLLVAFLGVIDFMTGYEISFSIFYLLPIALASWFLRRPHAVMIAFWSAMTWFLADLMSGHTYSHFAIPIWNAVMRLGFFLLCSFSLSSIKQLYEKEKKSALFDFLTGVANSKAFYDLALMEIDRAVRFNRPLTIAYIDIDNFKQVNDIFGHSTGDVLLHSVAQTIKENIRSTDIVARLGGDEFAILLPETNDEQARLAIDKVQKSLLDVVKQNKWPVTFSIGVITCHNPGKLEDLIKEADKLMYSVKESGKNRVKYESRDMSVTGTDVKNKHIYKDNKKLGD